MDYILYATVLFVAGSLMGFLKEYKAVTKASSLMGFLGSLVLLFPVISVYLNGPYKTSIYGIPVYIDGLSSIFLLVISLVGMAASLFSINYMDYYERKGKGWVYALTYNVFILAMMYIVIVNSFEWFVFFWELMTLSSFILMFFSEERKDIDASLKYYITMHFFNTFPLFLSLGIAYSLVGSFSKLTFPMIAAALAAAPITTKVAFTVLTLLAFMTKAGVVPFHYWLPDAHPAAPSNVSALLSGTMIKMAVYGMVRSVFTIIGPSLILGYSIAVLGVVTLVVGTFYALRENIAKRLLAYSSVENMGYIWFGIGIGIALIPLGGVYSAIGAIALFAGLFHVINHAIFKGSLFLTAGAIIYATGEKDLSKISGLSSQMKATALAALFSSLAISGIPPFNGFLSKWLLYIAGYYSGSLVLSIGSVMAVFMSALTLAFSLKFYGAPFGGETSLGSRVKEVPATMLAGQWLLAALALVIGVIPYIVAPLANAPTGAPVKLTYSEYGYFTSIFEPLYFTTILVIATLAAYMLFRPKLGGYTKPWDCGSTSIDEDEYRIRADGFYLWYERKVSSFYRFTDWAYSLGYSLVKLIVKGYLWIARFFIKIVDTPYTRVESIEEARNHEVMYIDEETFKPLIRFLKNLRSILPGLPVGKIVSLVVVTVVVIAVLFALL